eukprot:727862-Rhodomonas_salina.3
MGGAGGEYEFEFGEVLESGVAVPEHSVDFGAKGRKVLGVAEEGEERWKRMARMTRMPVPDTFHSSIHNLRMHQMTYWSTGRWLVDA